MKSELNKSDLEKEMEDLLNKYNHCLKTVEQLMYTINLREKKISYLANEIIVLEQKINKEIKKAEKNLIKEVLALYNDEENDQYSLVTAKDIKQLSKRLGIKID